jgi:hypothetical protein
MMLELVNQMFPATGSSATDEKVPEEYNEHNFWQGSSFAFDLDEADLI